MERCYLSYKTAYEELAKTQPRDTLVAQIAGVDDTFDVAGVIAAVAADKEKPQSQRNANLALVAMQVRAAVPGVLAERMPGFETAGARLSLA